MRPGHSWGIAGMLSPVPPRQQCKHHRFPAVHRQRQSVASVHPDPATALPQSFHQHRVSAAAASDHQLQGAGASLAAEPEFANLLYATLLTAYVADLEVTIQMRSHLGGYLEIDRIWMTE